MEGGWPEIQQQALIVSRNESRETGGANDAAAGTQLQSVHSLSQGCELLQELLLYNLRCLQPCRGSGYRA